MGRLIPAGTGMDFYRNVKVERDASVETAREEQPVEIGLSDLLGGTEPPAVVPAREKVAAVAAADGDGDAPAAADAADGDDE